MQIEEDFKIIIVNDNLVKPAWADFISSFIYALKLKYRKI